MWAEIQSMGCTTGLTHFQGFHNACSTLLIFVYFHLYTYFHLGGSLASAVGPVTCDLLGFTCVNIKSCQHLVPQFQQFSITSQATPHNMGTIGMRRIQSSQLFSMIQCIGDVEWKGTFFYWLCIKQYCFHAMFYIHPWLGCSLFLLHFSIKGYFWVLNQISYKKHYTPL